ncbi:MAG TPA: glycoside hydrolase family 15 protein [Falsiroseomonas sp.]|jgi:GH15 family glucan-1,4-alpha-glucosidase|nr:glycoside hydrolase family 15 protein [Falsiroseomonas sp.]
MEGTAADYPPIERLGVVGDRRTAAMVAADGTIGWLCLPDYDGEPVLGSLLDRHQGGFFRLGPTADGFGTQRYRNGTCTLLTRWEAPEGVLELEDTMVWPGRERRPADASRRVLLRRLRCIRGSMRCRLDLRIRPDFKPSAPPERVTGGWRFGDGGRDLGLWCSTSVDGLLDGETISGEFTLAAGEGVWAVLGPGEDPAAWSARATAAALEETEADWREWLGRLTYTGPRRDRVLRTAMTFRLLSHAPSGALVAAPTASLPERIGGDKNYDYRFAWIRDTSLALAILGMLGDLDTAERYMDWLAGLGSSTDMPLQVCYRVDGGTEMPERKRTELEGYRGSSPVLFGNQAAKQHQIDSLGYLADCALIYLEQGGSWKPEYGRMVRHLADFSAQHWRKPDNGIWELGAAAHYVSGKVMAWVALERASRIAERTGEHAEAVPHWRRTMQEIRTEVLAEGWSEARQAFRQRYGAEALDASVLLMAMMDFLPSSDPRLRATVARVEKDLTINGLVHRFRPEELPNGDRSDLPMGAFEGAFLPCCFWLAAAQAKEGRPAAAEAILDRVEATAGELGLLAEEMDADRRVPRQHAAAVQPRRIPEGRARDREVAATRSGRADGRYGAAQGEALAGRGLTAACCSTGPT